MKAAYSTRGGFCIQLVPVYLSYVGTGKPTKTLCLFVCLC